MPLKAYRDQNAFKVFMLDIGLLGAMSRLSPAALVDGSSIFTEFKGALTEQYVCQQLVSDCGLVPFTGRPRTPAARLTSSCRPGPACTPSK